MGASLGGPHFSRPLALPATGRFPSGCDRPVAVPCFTSVFRPPPALFFRFHCGSAGINAASRVLASVFLHVLWLLRPAALASFPFVPRVGGPASLCGDLPYSPALCFAPAVACAAIFLLAVTLLAIRPLPLQAIPVVPLVPCFAASGFPRLQPAFTGFIFRLALSSVTTAPLRLLPCSSHLPWFPPHYGCTAILSRSFASPFLGSFMLAPGRRLFARAPFRSTRRVVSPVSSYLLTFTRHSLPACLGLRGCLCSWHAFLLPPGSSVFASASPLAFFFLLDTSWSLSSARPPTSSHGLPQRPLSFALSSQDISILPLAPSAPLLALCTLPGCRCARALPHFPPGCRATSGSISAFFFCLFL